MNLLILGLAAAAATWPNIGAARGVEYQDFGQLKPSNFVLGTPARSNDAPDMRVRGDDDLATEFLAMGEKSAEQPVSSSEPSSNFLPDTVWQRQRNLGSQADAMLLAALAWSDGCPNEGYMPNPALPAAAERRRATWYSAMASASCEAGVPVALFDALIVQESGYNPVAASSKGAAGMAQLMPSSARILGVRNVWNPIDNMRGGARYLRALLNEFGRFDLALAAYNAGEGRVRAARQVPRIRETVNYVSSILLTMRDQFRRRFDAGERNLMSTEP